MLVRLLPLLLVLIAGSWLPGPLVAPAGAARKAPIALDCTTLPCAEIMPAAAHFRPVEGTKHWQGLDADGDIVGWVALSTDFVDIKAYSGKPLVTLIGLDPDGVITGARVIHHSEPILLIGIPEQALHDFVSFYAGQPALQRIVVGRTDKPDVVSVDAISGATVTVLAQNITVLDAARALGTAVDIFDVSATTQGHFVEEPVPWTFQQMLEKGALGHLVVTHADMGVDETSDPYVDLYFGVVDAPQVGKSMLGEHSYNYYKGQLIEGEHLFVVFNRGSGSFKGSAFVRGGIFDRVRVQQGLREITFRDTDYWNQPDVSAADAPEVTEGALFILRGDRFDPGSPYELVFLGSRYDRRSGFSREYREFTASHQIPESVYIVDKTASGIPWRQAWRNRQLDVGVFAVYLLLVVGVFVARQYTTAGEKRLGRLHLASMIFSFLVVGVYMGAQPSVTQIFTAVGSVIHEWRWDLFLSEPLIFISWIFIIVVSAIWGRGVFCGWVCPYGAMNELAFKITQKLGFQGFELPDAIHLKLRYLRYGILALLLGVFLWDSILAERMAEVEPFKSTFLVPIWTRSWGFVVWWSVLFLLSFLMYRPFCRYICPMGGGLALFSSFRPSGPKRRAFCSSCQICTRACEPRAFRPDGSIDPRECLSCMECEATYRDDQKCPPVIGLAMLEDRDDLTPRDHQKVIKLRIAVADV
ncbi:MAG: 4Fe-4S binding protein [Deltaproteobacteria bacterium]|nr:4Fe-4S binding protein [Deltaproteobacteria bacterium]MBW2697700.1 4Fe-4S binding protein [Deltaproteobacteria bacterium]